LCIRHFSPGFSGGTSVRCLCSPAPGAG